MPHQLNKVELDMLNAKNGTTLTAACGPYDEDPSITPAGETCEVGPDEIVVMLNDGFYYIVLKADYIH